MAVFFFWQWMHGGITPPEVAKEVPRALHPARRVASPPPAMQEALEPEGPPLPRVTRKKPRSRPAKFTGQTAIVLIVDDLGFEGQPLDRVMALDPNMSCSILPNGPMAGQFAQRLHEKGYEILCHLPMQPRGREHPGPGAILVSMSDEQIAETTRMNIDRVPNARGMNNHMGSLATSDRRVMTSVLGALPSGMYFIDSRTSGRSVAADVAEEMHIPTATRHVFLDDIAEAGAIRKQLDELVATARHRGLAIGIGHPYPATIAVLEADLPKLRDEGVRIVRASEAVQ